MPAPVVRLPHGDVEGFGACVRRDGGRSVLRPRQPATHPLFDSLNRRRWQFASGWHLQIAVVADHLDEQAIVGVARHGHALGGQKVGAGIERQPPLGVAHRTGVALAAVLYEERPHLRLEEFEIGRLGNTRLGPNRFRSREGQGP